MIKIFRVTINGVTVAIVALGMIVFASAPIKSAYSKIRLTDNQTFAACVVHENQAGSEALVRSDPSTEDEERYFSDLATSIRGCDRKVKNHGHFPGRPMFRGMLAERLWVGRVSAFMGTAGMSNDPSRINYDVGFDAAGAFRDNYRLAFCVASTQPVLVDNLLRTRVQSHEERQIFTSLTQAVSRCLPVGRSVSLNREWLRASLAEQLFRRFPAEAPPKSRSDVLLKHDK